MKAEYINPFLTAVNNAFKTMMDCPVERGQPYLRSQTNPRHEYSGIIGLSGKTSGMVVLSLSTNVALHATSALLMLAPEQTTTSDIVDAVGELANVVAGQAKAKLEALEMSISLPTVITGENHAVRFPSDVKTICVPFTCPWGPLMIEVGLAPAASPAPAEQPAATV